MPETESIRPPAGKQPFKWFGPGIIMAASGIGASDIITATAGGAAYGLSLLWALVLGAFFKFVLSEGLARWHLATGMTAVEGWSRCFPRWVMKLFAAYLVLWSVAVSGALVSACGLAVETLTRGAVSGKVSGLIQGAVALALILTSRTGWLERVMKPLVVLMFAAIVACAALTFRNPVDVLRGLFIPGIPEGGGGYLLSLIGGVGGSVTLLGHNYLSRGEGDSSSRTLRHTRLDLVMAYLFTGIFGLSVMLIANRVFHVPGIVVTEAGVVSRMAELLATFTGPVGFYIYAIGFWAAVFASLVGVWTTMPRVFADCHGLLRGNPPQQRREAARPSGAPHRASLVFMALSAVPIVLMGRPFAVVIAFTILGSLFIPFLAGSLLYLNNHVTFPPAVPRNDLLTNLILWLVILLYVLIGMAELIDLRKGLGWVFIH